MLRVFLVFFVLLSPFLLMANFPPIVSNVTAAQREDGSFLVDIYYDLYDIDGDPMTISMQVSDDNGITWDMSCLLIIGDVGEDIFSGLSKHVIWNLGAEHPNIEGDDFRFKIIADDGFTGGFGTVTDIDGNVYQTLIIGDQEWMIENLKVTHYNNGNEIPNLTDNYAWHFDLGGAYCAYNNENDNVDTYGYLYNWYAVNTGMLAPVGWHVPSDEEIKQLEIYLGMSENQAHSLWWRGTNEGSKLAGDEELWQGGALEQDPDFDLSGYQFLPGGYRSSEGFYNLNRNGYFWSATGSQDNPNGAWGRQLKYDTTQVFRNVILKTLGCSIRCVKD